MADCKSPIVSEIVSVRSRSLWHSVAVRSGFIITKRFTHLLFLAPVAVLRRRHSNKKELTKHTLAATATTAPRLLSAKYFYQGSCDGQVHLLLNRLTEKRQYHPSPEHTLTRFQFNHCVVFITVCFVFSTKAQHCV